MASTAIINFRLNSIGRATLWAATMLARIGIRVPHRFVIAITNRAWQMQTTADHWQPIRIDDAGRIAK